MKRVCGTCQGRGGIGGPCRECGALPPVDLMSAPAPSQSDATVVSLRGNRSRRVALGVVTVVVVAFMLNIVWDPLTSGSDSSDGGGAGLPEPSTVVPRTTTTTRPPSNRPPRAVVDDDAVFIEPVEGFEDQWLIVVGQPSRVWQIPLGGGVTEMIGRMRGQHAWTEHLVDGVLLSYDGGFSLRDGSTWRLEDSARWSAPIGPTASGTVVHLGQDTIVEYSAQGQFLRDWPVLRGMNLGWTYPVGPAGDRVVLQGVQGISVFDLRSGEHRRIATGQVLAVGTDALVATTCDDRFECANELIAVSDGSVLGVIGSEEFASRLHSNELRPFYMNPSLSPDDSRFALLVDGLVEIYDTATGDQVGAIAIPDTERAGLFAQVSLVWAPSSQAGLLIVQQTEGPVGDRAGRVVWFDRDLRDARVLADLGDALRPPSRTGGQLSVMLSDEGFAALADP
jgi:hypothetical protein